MNIRILMASAAMLALAACGDNNQVAEPDNVILDNMAMDSSSGMPTDNMATDATLPANGQEYATMAAGGDLYEIESSRLAIEKSKRADIKELAQMIVKDHEKSTVDLTAAAGKAQPPITVTPAMNPEQQANVEALRTASDAEFDQAYLQQQVAAHQKALTMVQAYAATGDVESLKGHAAAVAGPIQKHLERAQQLLTVQ